MPIFKRGSDNILNGAILGAVIGVLVATSNLSWIQSIVNMVMTAIPSGWISWAGNYGAMAVFGLIGFIAGYIIDYY